MADAPEEGGPCPGCGWEGLTYQPDPRLAENYGCSCHIRPPCGTCESTMLTCEACGWREEDLQ